MKSTIKVLLSIFLALIFSTIGFLFYGLNLMDKEDRYGNLVYYNNEVKDGDLIFKNQSNNKDSYIKYTEAGVIEKSFNKVYVWDLNHTIKKDLYTWSEENNESRRIVIRNNSIKNIQIKKGNYNQFIVENKANIIVSD